MLKNSSDIYTSTAYCGVFQNADQCSVRLASSPHLEFPVLSIVPTLWLAPTPRPDTQPFLLPDQILSTHPFLLLRTLPLLKCPTRPRDAVLLHSKFPSLEMLFLMSKTLKRQFVLVAMPRSQRPRIWWQKYLAKLIADNLSVC